MAHFEAVDGKVQYVFVPENQCHTFSDGHDTSSYHLDHAHMTDSLEPVPLARSVYDSPFTPVVHTCREHNRPTDHVQPQAKGYTPHQIVLQAGEADEKVYLVEDS